MTLVQDDTHPTGVSTTPGDKGGSNLTRARLRKALSAVDLKIRGYKLEDIAIALGYPSGRHVAVAIETALENELRETDKSALRQIAGRRLEQAIRSLHDKISDPNNPEHLAAVNTWVKVVDRYAKLMGLDAPTEVIITSPHAQEIEEWIEKAHAMASGNPEMLELQEADILEGDFIEDDEEDEV